MVLFASPSEVVVGMQAKRQARVRPDEVASLVKRHMGDGGWRFRAHGQDYSAPAVASQVIAELAAGAARATGEAVHDVVVTVPAYFGDEERKATKLAGELAGLNVVDIINEPTAAAFAYGFGQQGAASETVLVYDLGGGTFDSTVISLAERRIDVVATDGDHELGGADWDERLVAHLSQQFQEAQPQAGDPLDDSYATQDLLGMAEETKQALSGRESAEAFVFYNGGRAAVTVTRAQFEELTASLLERTIELTRRVLAAARNKGVPSVDRVLLVGGMSKSPAVARRLRRGVRVHRPAGRSRPGGGEGCRDLRPEEGDGGLRHLRPRRPRRPRRGPGTRRGAHGGPAQGRRLHGRGVRVAEHRRRRAGRHPGDQRHQSRLRAGDSARVQRGQVRHASSPTPTTRFRSSSRRPSAPWSTTSTPSR